MYTFIKKRYPIIQACVTNVSFLLLISNRTFRFLEFVLLSCFIRFVQVHTSFILGHAVGSVLTDRPNDLVSDTTPPPILNKSKRNLKWMTFQTASWVNF